MKTPTYIIALSVLFLTPSFALADWDGRKPLGKNERPHHWDHKRGQPHSYDGASKHDQDRHNHSNDGVGHRYQIGSQKPWNRGGHNDSYSYRSPYRPGYAAFSQSADTQIRQGINSGRLSSREVSELRQKEAEIRRKEIALLRDGHLSSSERGEIQGNINEFNKKLNHELNDGEKRW